VLAGGGARGIFTCDAFTITIGIIPKAAVFHACIILKDSVRHTFHALSVNPNIAERAPEFLASAFL
jgi:hypothetical protein